MGILENQQEQENTYEEKENTYEQNQEATADKQAWVINKIGMVNFWYYDEEEFEFEDGRLLLRGTNGSGKSVTMQSFIPLLLDGNKSPERLDPFGSRARKIDNYLLGEEDSGKDESTGYLYMEFIKPKTSNYLTIGMGLRSRRGKSLDFWGFCINDGRRIGEDFFLYKDVGQKIPLTKTELKNRISEGGEVHDSQRDYMSMVNQLLFGFETIEEYDELIKLLIQIRTPKLSKGFKPTIIYEIINNSLQPLSDEDLRPMSEAIENMDNIKTGLEVLRESKKACDRIYGDYENYNKCILFEKSSDFLKSVDYLKNLEKEKEKNVLDGQSYIEKVERAKKEKEDLNIKEESLKHRETNLKKHDGYTAKQELEYLLEKIKGLEVELGKKRSQFDSKKRREHELSTAIFTSQDEKYNKEKDIRSYLDEMSDCAEDLYYYEHDFMSDEFLKDIEKEYNFQSLKNDANRLKEKIVSARVMYERQKTQNELYDRALKELDRSKKDREDLNKDLSKAENKLFEARENFVESIYSWEDKNHELKIHRQELTHVCRAVNRFGEEGTYDDILKAVREQFDVKKDGLNAKRLELESDRERLQGEIYIKKEELDGWKKRKDPEPKRSDRVIGSRQRLLELKIPHIPFYKACDFKEGVDEQTRGVIEEALEQMGVLDSLIVPSEYKDVLANMPKGMMDKVIFPSSLMPKNNLSNCLEPVCLLDEDAIDKQVVEDCLNSIALDNESHSASLDLSGTYSLGVLRGKTSTEYVQKFIGHEARKAFKIENIEMLEQEISEKGQILNEIDYKIKEIKERVDAINTEFSNFPPKSVLEVALRFIEETKYRLSASEKELGKKEEYVNGAYLDLKNINEELLLLTAKLEFGKSLEAYVKAENDINRYREMIQELEGMHGKFLALIDKLKSLEEQKQEIELDADNIAYDLKNVEVSIEEDSQKVKNYEQILSNLNFEDIEKEIEECIRELKIIPKKKEEALDEISRNEERYKQTLKSLEALDAKIEYALKEKDLRETLLRKENSLGYLDLDEKEEEFSNLGLEKEPLVEAVNGLEKVENLLEKAQNKLDMIVVAKKIVKELKQFYAKGKSSSDYSNSLQNKYHENRQYLAEYNLIIENLFEDSGEFDNLSEVEDDNLRKIVNTAKRIDFRARVQGKDVSFIILRAFVSESMMENEQLLKESDRQLFEDILANTVGKKIRSKIKHSQMWVKKMNSLMEGMNTSSGLSFSLLWRKKVAQTDEEIGTKELVDILNSNTQLLSEEQLETISSHFRSKIASARKEQEQKGINQSFHAIMKDVLDYRKWFEFQLLYKKTGEPKRELTDNAFDRFSGGEKAMAMYVPLFSAVYARFSSARVDAPRLISLDEAFAGVDENNIRDMFKLLNELKLSFVINSQILWGDYDTVPSLSICELVRPNNADFVTVIRYKWDGKVKQLVV